MNLISFENAFTVDIILWPYDSIWELFEFISVMFLTIKCTCMATIDRTFVIVVIHVEKYENLQRDKAEGYFGVFFVHLGYT